MSEHHISQKDWCRLFIVLNLLVSVSLGALALASKLSIKTPWFSLHSEPSLHPITSKKPPQQQIAQDLERDLKIDGPLVVLKDTSEIEILFSRSETTSLRSFNHSDKIPEVHY